MNTTNTAAALVSFASSLSSFFSQQCVRASGAGAMELMQIAIDLDDARIAGRANDALNLYVQLYDAVLADFGTDCANGVCRGTLREAREAGALAA